jgi:predicted DNA-binding transcriptional regulator AlpA
MSNPTIKQKRMSKELFLRSDGFVDKKCAMAFLCISSTTFDRLLKKGVIPAPLKIGTKNVWPAAQIHALADRIKIDGGIET